MTGPADMPCPACGEPMAQPVNAGGTNYFAATLRFDATKLIVALQSGGQLTDMEQRRLRRKMDELRDALSEKEETGV